MTQDSTQTDQLYLLYRQMPGTALSTCVTAVVTAAVLMSVLPFSKLISWLTAVLLLNATRYFLAIVYAAQDPSKPNQSRWKMVRTHNQRSEWASLGLTCRLHGSHCSICLSSLYCRCFIRHGSDGYRDDCLCPLGIISPLLFQP